MCGCSLHAGMIRVHDLTAVPFCAWQVFDTALDQPVGAPRRCQYTLNTLMQVGWAVTQ
jgi:hypothetical protein